MTLERPSRKSIALVFALVCTALACQEAAPPPDPPPRAIRWMRVSGSIPAEDRVVSGIVTAVDDTRLAFEVGGTVLSVDARLGDLVKRGDVLARLDPEPFELAVRDANAAVAQAIAQQQAARSDFERTKSLFEQDVASRQEFDRDTARRDSADSQVKATQARLDLAERDLRRSVLRAPFDGSISVREIDPAMKVVGGQTAFEMDSGESGLRVEVQMPETLITRVRQGDPVGVEFPSIGGVQDGESRFEAVVTEVGTRAGTGNAFPVRADLASPPQGLRPGMTAEIHFLLPRVEADAIGLEGFLVPVAAVKIGQDPEFSVFEFDAETSTVRSKAVQSGGVRDNEVAILSGLQEGDIIATAGVSFLRDGQEVQLLDEKFGRRN